MKKHFRLLALACALTACGDDKEDTYRPRNCPNLNGTFEGTGGSAVIDTRIEGDEENTKFKYNFGDGMIWLEADGEPFTVPFSTNSMRATCGYRSVTLHTTMNGETNQVTYSDTGDNAMEVSYGSYAVQMKRTGEAPIRKPR